MKELSQEDKDMIAQQLAVIPKERKGLVVDDVLKTTLHALVASGELEEEKFDDVLFEALMTVLEIQSLDEMARILAEDHKLTPTEAHFVMEQMYKLLAISAPQKVVGQATAPTAPHVCSPTTVITEDVRMHDRLQKLPSSVQGVITSAEHASAFHDLCSTYSLGEAKARLLCEQIARVMLGIATTKDLNALLSGGTVVNTTQAKEMMASIEASMLAPVRRAIVKTLESHKQGGSAKVASDPYKEPVA